MASEMKAPPKPKMAQNTSRAPRLRPLAVRYSVDAEQAGGDGQHQHDRDIGQQKQADTFHIPRTSVKCGQGFVRAWTENSSPGSVTFRRQETRHSTRLHRIDPLEASRQVAACGFAGPDVVFQIAGLQGQRALAPDQGQR